MLHSYAIDRLIRQFREDVPPTEDRRWTTPTAEQLLSHHITEIEAGCAEAIRARSALTDEQLHMITSNRFAPSPSQLRDVATELVALRTALERLERCAAEWAVASPMKRLMAAEIRRRIL